MLRIIATVRAEVPAEWPAVRHSYGGQQRAAFGPLDPVSGP